MGDFHAGLYAVVRIAGAAARALEQSPEVDFLRALPDNMGRLLTNVVSFNRPDHFGRDRSIYEYLRAPSARPIGFRL